jgi:hypothetical protein
MFSLFTQTLKMTEAVLRPELEAGCVETFTSASDTFSFSATQVATSAFRAGTSPDAANVARIPDVVVLVLFERVGTAVGDNVRTGVGGTVTITVGAGVRHWQHTRHLPPSSAW